MGRSEVDFKNSDPFVIQDEDVAKLVDAFSDFADNVTLMITCSNRTVREITPDRLSGIENSSLDPVTELRINASRVPKSEDDKTARYANLKVAGSLDTSAWSRSLKGPEQAVAKLDRQIDEIMSSTKPWYTFLYGPVFIGIQAIAVMVALGLIAVVFRYIGWRLDHLFLVGPVVVIAAAASIYGLRLFCFPFGTIAINQGKRRYDTWEKFRWCVVIGAIVSFLASLLLSAFLTPFQSRQTSAAGQEVIPADRRSLAEFIQAYRENEPSLTTVQKHRFFAKEAGKRFQWTALLRDVFQSGNTAFLELSPDSSSWYFTLHVKLVDQSDVAHLKVGDRIMVDGVMNENGELESCRVTAEGSSVGGVAKPSTAEAATEKGIDAKLRSQKAPSPASRPDAKSQRSPTK